LVHLIGRAALSWRMLTNNRLHSLRELHPALVPYPAFGIAHAAVLTSRDESRVEGQVGFSSENVA